MKNVMGVIYTGEKDSFLRELTLLRAIAAGEVSEAYLAMDADLFIARQVREACEKAGVRLTEVSTMKQLGQACGIEVKTASAGIRK